MSEKQFPIAEIFTSPQGEGVYTGVMMTFIRLAGCSVGKLFPAERYPGVSVEPWFKDSGVGAGCPVCDSAVCYDRSHNPAAKLLPVYTEMCTLYDGRTFECDTDYRVKERLTVDEILERVPRFVGHICISGGEPFIHNLTVLTGQAHNRRLSVHIETSGTLPLDKAFGEYPERSWSQQQSWITVSPKLGIRLDMLNRANEIKLLVDENFDTKALPHRFNFNWLTTHTPVYLQPVNYENTANMENLKRCLALQEQYPQWRVSVQMHKIMGVR